jgi:hypothetical protein
MWPHLKVNKETNKLREMENPYKNFDKITFWRNAVTGVSWGNIFDDCSAKFKLKKDTKVSTMGSCFAQRLSSWLISTGKNFYVVEKAHSTFRDLYNRDSLESYGRFSARYGNIYTTTQFKQIIEEAFEKIPPINNYKKTTGGYWIDLMRPNAVPDGFLSEDEARADRNFHLKKCRELFTNTDVLFFTLGLTEAWEDCNSGIIYGIHPNTQNLSEEIKCNPVNFTYVKVQNDLLEALSVLKEVNPNLKIIFTVSQVGLNATHQSRHVLISTTHSKSILRSVAGEMSQKFDFVDYFMSYELINSPQSFGQYLSEDLRDANSRGIKSVMNLFEQLYFEPSQNKIDNDNKFYLTGKIKKDSN